jgi:hypothetical protein
MRWVRPSRPGRVAFFFASSFHFGFRCIFFAFVSSDVRLSSRSFSLSVLALPFQRILCASLVVMFRFLFSIESTSVMGMGSHGDQRLPSPPEIAPLSAFEAMPPRALAS